MKSLILFVLLAVAFSLETADFLPPKKPAALKPNTSPRESPLAELQRLVKQFPNQALCLQLGKHNQLIAKSPAVLAALKGKVGKGKVQVLDCAHFMAEHAKKQAKKVELVAKKAAKANPKAKPQAHVVAQIKKVAEHLKESLKKVAANPQHADSKKAAKEIKKIEKLVAKAGKSAGAAKKAAKTLVKTAEATRKKVAKLEKKETKKKAVAAPAVADACWAKASALINNAKCQLK